ncbi:uncharacterized protein N7459_001088 [Penicillium hispanicum]|uniref:uncharacterized protein n=1 Tax=Penicillium hispanicum TaxID=1080232 RepID=UPI002540FB4D|nr:uncharacterized protein N7459_001088 [Penicillium hispanicum]KAJ5594880.1 hypothetical protein N7459_001088 [Penicillium hispanicum]
MSGVCQMDDAEARFTRYLSAIESEAENFEHANCVAPTWAQIGPVLTNQDLKTALAYPCLKWLTNTCGLSRNVGPGPPAEQFQPS